MKRRAIVALALALTGLGCSPDLDWREVRADEAPARLLLPCRPVRHQRQVDLEGRSRTMELMVCDAGGISWALAVVRLHSEAEQGAVELALARAIQANLAAERITAEGRPPNAAQASALRVQRWVGRMPDGRPVETVTAFASSGVWLAQATAIGPGIPAEAAQMLVESLRVGT